MSDQNVTVNNTSSGGVGFIGLLTIVLITLKLLGVITWSWWLVFLPLLICVAISLVIIIGFIVAIYIFRDEL